jgi:hypothetical protein
LHKSKIEKDTENKELFLTYVSFPLKRESN